MANGGLILFPGGKHGHQPVIEAPLINKSRRMGVSEERTKQPRHPGELSVQDDELFTREHGSTVDSHPLRSWCAVRWL